MSGAWRVGTVFLLFMEHSPIKVTPDHGGDQVAMLNEVMALRAESEQNEKRFRVADKVMKRAARREMAKRLDTYSGLSMEEIALLDEDEWDDFVEVVR